VTDTARVDRGVRYFSGFRGVPELSVLYVLHSRPSLAAKNLRNVAGLAPRPPWPENILEIPGT